MRQKSRRATDEFSNAQVASTDNFAGLLRDVATGHGYALVPVAPSTSVTAVCQSEGTCRGCLVAGLLFRLLNIFEYTVGEALNSYGLVSTGSRVRCFSFGGC